MPDVPVCGILDFLQFSRHTGAGRNAPAGPSGWPPNPKPKSRPTGQAGLPWHDSDSRTVHARKYQHATGAFPSTAAHKSPPVHTQTCPALPCLPQPPLLGLLLLAFPCFFLVSRAGGEAATASTRGHAHRDAALLHSLLRLRGERAHRTLRLAVAAPSPLARAFFLPLLLRPACRRFFVSELGGFDLVTLVGNNQKN